MPPAHKKGKIIAYSNMVNAGTILGESGQIYLFSRKDWGLPQEPEIDSEVFFVAEGDRAKRVRLEND